MKYKFIKSEALAIIVILNYILQINWFYHNMISKFWVIFWTFIVLILVWYAFYKRLEEIEQEKVVKQNNEVKK